MVLVDAGPLVALIHKDDAHHTRCVATLRAISEPLGTVWPALTEAMYLLSFSWRAQDALWEMVEREVVHLLALDGRDILRTREVMKKYKDLPMDLADAALVAVAEREKVRRIFTLDRRDFEIYRPTKLGRFIILPE
jgi:predicted nucleic acid-binding protein